MDNNNFNNSNVYGAPEQGVAPQPEQPQAAPEQPVYDANANMYGQPQGSYDANANMYSQPQAAPEQPVYDANANMYSQPQGSYDANANMYSQPQAAPEQPVYDANANMYSQPQGSYDANANMYSQPQGGYDANANMYSQPQGSYEQTASVYTQGSYDAGNSYASYNTGAAGEILDKNGAPAKNNFVMKLIFSILEILTVFGCNIISCAMGIVGLIFNFKANKAFKEGDAETFHKSKKTSALMLWIGLGVQILVVIICVVLIVVGVVKGNSLINDALSDAGLIQDDNDYDYDFDYDYDYDWDNDLDDVWDGDWENDLEDDWGWDDDTSDEQSSDVVVSLNDEVIYDVNGVTIYAQSITYKTDYNGNTYPVFSFVAENNSNENMTVYIKSIEINGVEVCSYPADDTIMPGKKANLTADVSYYGSSAYATMGYPEVGLATFGAFCYCENTEAENDDATYYTSLQINDAVTPYIPTGTIMYQDETLEVYYIGEQDGFMTFYTYYNGPVEDVVVYVEDISINNFMQNDYAYMNVRPGMGIFGRMYVNSDMDTDAISSASAYISVRDNDTWEQIVQTDEIYFIQ